MLTVRSNLRVTLQPAQVVADLGKSAEFFCSINGDSPSSVSISWMKDGVTIRSGSVGGRIRFMGQTRMQVLRVAREDQGMYQCFAKNDYETAQQSAQLVLGGEQT